MEIGMVNTIILYTISKAVGKKNLQLKPLKEVIPKAYHKCLLMFSMVIAELLPLHQPDN
jgi:hypothetical protein